MSNMIQIYRDFAEYQKNPNKKPREIKKSGDAKVASGIYSVREFFLFQDYIMARYIVFDVETPNRYNNRISGERAACVFPNLGVEG